MNPVPRVACLAGDGIGPEVVAVARAVLDAAGFEADWSDHPVGWTCWTTDGEALPAATLEACRAADTVLFGAITSRPEDAAQAALPARLRGTVAYRSPVLRLRQELDLWANVRPVQGNGLDLVLFRENTEGLYAGAETTDTAALHGAFPDLTADAVSLRVVTRAVTERIVRAAFDHARSTGRRRVTLLEKANVLRVTGGLVRSVFYEVAGGYPDLVADDLHIDAACALLVRDPGRFDVVVATNLFGDIFSDLAAELAGGLGTAASANLGDAVALFEPVHGSAPDIAGQGVADPRGAVRAAAWMARHLGQTEVADRIDAALDRVPARSGTSAWADALVAAAGPGIVA